MNNFLLRIFSALNDRGLPLSDADIFKAQFYKYYSDKCEKTKFIIKWKDLEEVCEKIFNPVRGTPMDELFTRYMYCERAKQGMKSSSTEALRKFYEKNSYFLLKNDDILNDLIDLANFWYDISNQNTDKFSNRILKKLFVLNYAPNGMWTYFVSVYFMHNKDSGNLLNEEKFYVFLNKIIAFIWTYAIYNPGVNALRTPVFAEMVNIVNGKEVEFNDFKFEYDTIKQIIENYEFYNGRPITKSMLAWWAFENGEQELLSIEGIFEIEHIFAKNRQEIERVLSNNKNIEILGNKSLLEKRINICAANYRFNDKIKYYRGFTTNKGIFKHGTQFKELIKIADEFSDFFEQDILNRNNEIINGFLDYLRSENLFN